MGLKGFNNWKSSKNQFSAQNQFSAENLIKYFSLFCIQGKRPTIILSLPTQFFQILMRKQRIIRRSKRNGGKGNKESKIWKI